MIWKWCFLSYTDNYDIFSPGRNYGVGDTQVQMEMKAIKHQKSEFIMKVGKHEANVICKNKREGKQQAAQAILQVGFELLQIGYGLL